MWSIYFCIGACVEKIFTKKEDRTIIYVLGFICFGIIILKKYFFSYQNNIHDLMPSYTIYAIACYVFLKNLDIQPNEKIQKIILFLGKQSFGIFLIHFLCIWYFIRLFPNTIGLSAYLYWAICIISVFIASLFISYIIDAIIVKPIQKALLLTTKKKED